MVHNTVAHHQLTKCPAHFWAWSSMISNIPLISWDHLSQPYSLLTPWLTEHRNVNSPWLSVSITYQQLKHQCVIGLILILHPKHSPVLDTRKKINPILAETRIRTQLIEQMMSWLLCHYMGAVSRILNKMLTVRPVFVFFPFFLPHCLPACLQSLVTPRLLAAQQGSWWVSLH